MAEISLLIEWTQVSSGNRFRFATTASKDLNLPVFIPSIIHHKWVIDVILQTLLVLCPWKSQRQSHSRAKGSKSGPGLIIGASMSRVLSCSCRLCSFLCFLISVPSRLPVSILLSVSSGKLVMPSDSFVLFPRFCCSSSSASGGNSTIGKTSSGCVALSLATSSLPTSDAAVLGVGKICASCLWNFLGGNA